MSSFRPHTPGAAGADLKRSRVTDGHISSGRTSSSMFLTGEKGTAAVVQLLERRIEETAILAHGALESSLGPPPASYTGAEPVQVVRYQSGQGYCACVL